MRQIDWDSELSAEDVAWIRQAGFVSEERIAAHQAQFGGSVPETKVKDDAVTQSALDPNGLTRGVPTPAGDGPIDVTPTPGDDAPEDEGDDYDRWKVGELENEVANRNALVEANTELTEINVVGTGKDGKIVKADLIKALRIWDDENPGALDEE